MNIHNVRVGLATNSSSSHSIIIMRPKDYIKTPSNELHEFGWQFFTAANFESKRNYLGYILLHSLTDLVGKDTAEIVVDSLFAKESVKMSDELRGGYIDHQSQILLPANWNGKGVNLEFFKDFKEYIMANPIAILGGNDNDEESHPLIHMGPDIDFGLPRDGSATTNLVARKDRVNNKTHWVVFNRESGTKVRLTFGDYDSKPEALSTFTGPTAQPVEKAEVPELVDIKITDFCPTGCKYCYQGSTAEGLHTEYAKLRNMAWSLGRIPVFEVALGGGEPTLHPQFIDILRDFRQQGIVPNFTTRNLAWLRKEGEEILDLCGAVAYSVNTGADVRRLLKAMKHVKEDYHPKFRVQYVLNTGGNLYEVLDEARKHYLDVTLLGFKRVGFGKDFPEVPEEWIPVVEKIRNERGYVSIGVDTAIVKESQETIMRSLNVPKALMTGEEGKFSMYIDAVVNKMGPSSYCNPSQMEPLDLEQNSLKERFATW